MLKMFGNIIRNAQNLHILQKNRISENKQSFILVVRKRELEVPHFRTYLQFQKIKKKCLKSQKIRIFVVQMINTDIFSLRNMNGWQPLSYMKNINCLLTLFSILCRQSHQYCIKNIIKNLLHFVSFSLLFFFIFILQSVS
jgi:hypothetical protein